MYEWEAFVTRNLHVHAKYEGSISNSSKVMTNVEVVQPTDQQTDRAKTVCPRSRYWGHKDSPWPSMDPSLCDC